MGFHSRSSKKIESKFNFENSKEYKFLDHRFDKIIDKDTIFIKFWIANVGKNLGLFKKIIKI